ncbi:hypothetical protein B0H67DRAFT_684340 [Lasiosphaeris hirsuta]|uniref:Uncharacterized protein n=1 Tax=Lasiosphaeris hirsuta TaxID=260670 RepID=A0AA40AIA4_9PEZI|nr:hypothetical protein B0H67DRAFT_684340 [Lasiosphaeris hirsuta]
MSDNLNLLSLLKSVPLSAWELSGHCSSTAPFIQELLENPHGPSITNTVNYLQDSVPPKVNTTGIATVELQAALLHWFLANPLPQKQIDLATAACKAYICPLLEWNGEPDASGIGPPRPIYYHILNSIKACIRLNVEFARALALALCISVAIASSDSSYSSHSISTGTYAATSFSLSFMILEFISWEWCQYKSRYFFIPSLFLAPLFCLLGITNSQKGVKTGTWVNFYRICYDFDTADNVANRLHHLALGFGPTILIAFAVWVVLGWNRRRRTRTSSGSAQPTTTEPRVAERVLQVFVVVLALLGQSIVLSSFVAFRGAIASSRGGRDPETVWTLGQILSLTAWVPVLIEFAYIVSSEDGL